MCLLGPANQHEARNGVIEIGFCLSRLYRSANFARESLRPERELLARAQAALVRVSEALRPCVAQAECSQAERSGSKDTED